jgi:hypothetical protein
MEQAFFASLERPNLFDKTDSDDDVEMNVVEDTKAVPGEDDPFSTTTLADCAIYNTLYRCHHPIGPGILYPQLEVDYPPLFIQEDPDLDVLFEEANMLFPNPDNQQRDLDFFKNWHKDIKAQTDSLSIASDASSEYNDGVPIPSVEETIKFWEWMDSAAPGGEVDDVSITSALGRWDYPYDSDDGTEDVAVDKHPKGSPRCN